MDQETASLDRPTVWRLGGSSEQGTRNTPGMRMQSDHLGMGMSKPEARPVHHVETTTLRVPWPTATSPPVIIMLTLDL